MFTPFDDDIMLTVIFPLLLKVEERGIWPKLNPMLIPCSPSGE